MPRVHLCCRICFPSYHTLSPCSSRSRLRSGQTSRLEYSLSGWTSQVCIPSTIVVFKYHLFIQKNNVFVFAFYCAANRSDFFVRGWGLPAESVCGRVGLVVAPESGAYTVDCINLLTFQEELAYYIYLGRRHTSSAFW